MSKFNHLCEFLIKALIIYNINKMKKLFIQVVFVFWIAGIGLAQAQDISWEKNLGGSDWDMAQTVIQTTDGGYMVAGGSMSDDIDVSGNYGGWDCWLVKLDDSGLIEWKNHYGGSGNDVCYSIIQTMDSGFIMAGYSESSDFDVTANNGQGDFWVVKLDDSGSIVWGKNYGGSKWERAYSVMATNDGGYIVAGESESGDQDVSGNHGDYDYWIIKLDSIGAIQWEKNFGGSGSDRARSIELTTDGGFIVAGESNSIDHDISANYGKNDYWLLKLDSIGNIEWNKNYGGSEADNAAAVITTTDGGYLIAGESHSTDHDVTVNYGNGDFWLVKVDNSGAVQWEKNYGGTDYDAAYSVFWTSDGGYIAAGLTSSSDNDVSQIYRVMDCWIIKVNSAGSLEWEQNFGGRDYETARCIMQAEDGGYIFAGYTDSSDNDVTKNNGSNDYWIVKLADNTVNLDKWIACPGISFYPNPSNGIVTTDLGKFHSYITVEVINSLGQTAGLYSFESVRIISFMLEGDAGLYLVRISASDQAGSPSGTNNILLKVYKK